MPLTSAQVLDRVSSALSGLSGWTVARQHFALMLEDEPREYAHQSYTVGLLEGLAADQRIGRSFTSGVYWRTRLAVAYSMRVRADAQAADYAAAVTAAGTLIARIGSSLSMTDMSSIRVDRVRPLVPRIEDRAGHLIGVVELTITHLAPW